MIPLPFLRSAYNYDVDEVSNETGLFCPEETLAQQNFKDECDINTIVEAFAVNGELPKDIRTPTFADFEPVGDFHSAMNAVAMAREAFDAMPANVRWRFHNDPGAFVAFCSDDANRAEAEKLGLVPAKPIVTDVSPQAVPSNALETSKEAPASLLKPAEKPSTSSST